MKTKLRTVRWVILTAAAMASGAAFWHLQMTGHLVTLVTAITYVATALVMATICRPLYNWLTRDKHVRRDERRFNQWHRKGDEAA